jgi:hypothetical protein
MMCHGTTTSGRPCTAPAQFGSRFCFFHDPQTSKLRLAAQRKGGSKQPPTQPSNPSPAFTFDTRQDILAVLAEAANRLFQLPFDTKAAYAVCQLADHALRVHDFGLQREEMDRLARLVDAEGLRTSGRDFFIMADLKDGAPAPQRTAPPRAEGRSDFESDFKNDAAVPEQTTPPPAEGGADIKNDTIPHPATPPQEDGSKKEDHGREELPHDKN